RTLPPGRTDPAPAGPLALQELGPLVEQRQHRLPPRRWQPEDGPGDARLGVGLERSRLRLRAEDGRRDSLHVAAGLGRTFAEVLQRGQDDLRRTPPGEPAVAEIHDALEGVRALATQEHGRPRLLGRLGPGPDLVELHELTVELRLVLGPDLRHGPHLLLEALEPR